MDPDAAEGPAVSAPAAHGSFIGGMSEIFNPIMEMSICDLHLKLKIYFQEGA